MVGFPYDDAKAWQGEYPAEVFSGQLAKIADGFDLAIASLKSFTPPANAEPTGAQAAAFQDELRVAEAASIHFHSAANQDRFNTARSVLLDAPGGEKGKAALDQIESILHNEIRLAQRLWEIQSADSRIGFEASNHYFYIPQDLIEKVINCRDLLERWVPEQRKRLAK
jgi:hypothetical protein